MNFPGFCDSSSFGWESARRMLWKNLVPYKLQAPDRASAIQIARQSRRNDA